LTTLQFNATIGIYFLSEVKSLMNYTINLIWDSESAVWIATSDDIQGLVLESGSLDALIERLRFAVPEFLALNGASKQDFSMCLRSERFERVSFA